VRAVGIDLGSRRIGVALSDSAGTLALPYEVVQRSGDRRRDHRRLAELVAEAEAEVLVVGIPYSLDGSVGPTARRYLAETEELRATIGVPVETYDERLTTVTAERSLRDTQLSGPARRKVVDQVAAAVMLQSWLDGRAGREERPRE
jgi:putative holliday junction resolvase